MPETEVESRKSKGVKSSSRTAKKIAAVDSGWFAVIATGGKQYRVASGKLLTIEKIQGAFKEGDKILFDKVLLFDDGKGNTTIGSPYISGSKVEATLEKIGRAKKVTVIKYKQKSRYFKKYGHRQPFFQVRIGSIK